MADTYSYGRQHDHRELRAVQAAFNRAWSEVLVGTALNADLTWAEAGVDSLKSFQLLLRLEELLERSLSFELFARDLTPGDLIQSLSEEVTGRPEAATAERTLFLVPGIFGDEPRLADFRRSLAGRVECVTLTLPELDRSSKLLSDMKATARLLLDELTERRPEGPIAIAGYSFGGLAAYQIATDLAAAGREVELLCLLDPIPALPGNVQTPPAAERQTQRPLWERLGKRDGETIYLALERVAFRALMASGQCELARRLVHASRKAYDFERWYWRRRDLLDVFRGRAMRTWTPCPCDVPTLLVTSELSRAYGFAQYWSNLCRNLRVEPVVGDHWGIFDPEPLAQLAPALLRALGRTSSATAARLESV